jgi:geranylgeranyl pyrophosphate synthase
LNYLNFMNFPSPAPLDSQAETFIGSVEKRLDSALSIPGSGQFTEPRGLLMKAARQLTLSDQAKRIRPLLVYFSGRIFHEENRNWVDIATAAELIHSASLLHDDVIDEAATRRHRLTANARWGNTVAVLSGDWLLTIALRHLRNVDPEVVRDAVDVVARMTETSIMEVMSRGRLDVTVAEWRKMAEGKTGSLFEWCARAATWEERDNGCRDRLSDCTKRLAVAFQMVDDLKDIVRCASGKDAFADIRNQELNSTILLAIDQSAPLRKDVARLWAQESPNEEEVRGVAERIAGSGAPEMIRRMVEREVAEGLEILGNYRNTPGGEQIALWAHSLMSYPFEGGHA